MRCGCIECGAFMIHADDAEACVCPECGHRCSACLGTNTVVSREQLKNLAAVRWINQDIDRARDALAGHLRELHAHKQRVDGLIASVEKTLA